MGRILVRFSSFSLCVLAAAGCDESTTLVLDPNPAVRIVIENARCPVITRCGTCVLETDAFDKNSQPAPFPTLLWSTANGAIATVEGMADGEARVSGWTTGGTTVAVEVLETGATDQVEVTIVPSLIDCTPP
jgi:hypothetical protein